MLPTVDQLIALGLTCLVEVPLFLLGCRALGWLGPAAGSALRVRQAVLLGLALNLVSHPLLWAVASNSPAVAGSALWVVTAEVGVVLLEALVVRLVVRRDAGWAVLLCVGTNAASLLAGLVLTGP